jgi:hypothetical protein
MPTNEGRIQRYVGPEAPELVERMAHHTEARENERERRALVSTGTVIRTTKCGSGDREYYRGTSEGRHISSAWSSSGYGRLSDL